MKPNLPLSASLLRSLPQKTIKDTIAGLSETEAEVLLYDWPFWARPDQLSPQGKWTHWLLLAGRGFGKTRTGAEWVRHRVDNRLSSRIALIAPTAADARDTMVEGESGLLAISPPWNRPLYEPAKRRLTWPNGAKAFLFSADEPDRLRGPQHDAAWADELAAWRYGESAWDMLLFGLRLGLNPQTCITTTPRPTPLIKGLLKQKNVHLTHGTTFDNLDNLAPTFREEIITKFEGTRLGRQELMAEVLDDVPGALWTADMIAKCRCITVPEMVKVVVAVDPPVTAGDKADECGCVVVGLGVDGDCYIIADRSSQGLSPLEWAQEAVSACYSHQASEIVVEVNQGGDLVETLIHQIASDVKVKPVRATRNKQARAEPVALLYEKGKVHHTARFNELEEQLTSFAPSSPSGSNGIKGRNSPDRLDALVWGVTALMISDHYAPRFRPI